jgi:hypothetical protein
VELSLVGIFIDREWSNAVNRMYESLAKAVDAINECFGDYTITPARMMGTQGNIPDRISFGGIKELEQFIT